MSGSVLRLGPDPGAGRVAAYGLGAATVFFVVSNLAVWVAAGGVYYSQDLAGLSPATQWRLPFFAYTLLGMAVYSGLLFGGMALVRRHNVQRYGSSGLAVCWIAALLTPVPADTGVFTFSL